jgi:hypothetical protein
MENTTTREKFLRIFNFDNSMGTLKWEFGYWIGALERWYKEGLPRVKGFAAGNKWGDALSGPAERSFINQSYIDEDVSSYFRLDKDMDMLPVSPWLFPVFEPQVIEEDEETSIVIDEDGIKKKIFKDFRSMPLFLEFPVKDVKDWEKIADERLNPQNLIQRIPKDFEKYVQKAKTRDYPLGILGYPCGFFGSLRFLFGPESLFLNYYDNPVLIKKINAHLCDLWINYFEELMQYTDFDFAFIWEDMASKNGMLISPAVFNEFMKPYYLRLTGFLKARGIKNIIVDSDGFIERLIPYLLESGVNAVLPLEKQAGNDLERIRKNFPELVMLGGFNKSILRDGNPDVLKKTETELNVIKEMMVKGGFIPFCDHYIPPDISWKNFKYYREKLNNMIDSMKLK